MGQSEDVCASTNYLFCVSVGDAFQDLNSSSQTLIVVVL